MTYTAAQARADYREMINGWGETITIRRLPSTDVSVKARLVNSDIIETTGVRQSSQRRFIIVAADLLAAGFSAPFQQNKDRILWNGKTLVITEVDESKRRVGGELIAYELWTAGA